MVNIMPCAAPAGAAVSDGTTEVACVFNGGVVIAADTRSSAGKIIVSRASCKIMRLAPNIVLCRAGTTAHTSNIARLVTSQLETLRMETGDPSSLKTAAHLLSKFCYDYPFLSAAFLIAGIDENGPSLWQVPVYGGKVCRVWAAQGSGSTYLMAQLDATFRPNFTRAEAEEYCARAVAHAIARDGSSGGLVRMATVTGSAAAPEVIEKNIFPDQLHYAYSMDQVRSFPCPLTLGGSKSTRLSLRV